MKNYVYRIKDLNSGKYYAYDKYLSSFYEVIPNQIPSPNYLYSYTSNATSSRVITRYLYFDDVGRFYTTKLGAQKIVTNLVGCSKNVRESEAGRILNSRFNLIVVKSELKLKDTKDEA